MAEGLWMHPKSMWTYIWIEILTIFERVGVSWWLAGTILSLFLRAVILGVDVGVGVASATSTAIAAAIIAAV